MGGKYGLKTPGVVVSSTSSSSNRPSGEFEDTSHDPCALPIPYRGRGGRGRGGSSFNGFQNGSRGNRRSGLGGSSFQARPVERSQTSATAFGGRAQGFPGASTRQEKDSTAAFTRQLEQMQNEDGGRFTDDDDEEMEEEVPMVKKATEKEDYEWNSGFGKEAPGETKTYGGFEGDEKQKSVTTGSSRFDSSKGSFSANIEASPTAPTASMPVASDVADSSTTLKPEPTTTPAASFSAVPSNPSQNPKPVASAPATSITATVSEAHEPTRQGPAGAVYTLETELPLPPAPSRFDKKVVTQTFEIQGRQIATQLSRVKIYEAHLHGEEGSSQVYITGATIHSLCLRKVLGGSTFYEVPYNSLHLYERINKELSQPDTNQIPAIVPPKTEYLLEKQKPVEITRDYSDDGWRDTPSPSVNPNIAPKTKPGVHTWAASSVPATKESFVEASNAASPLSAPFPSKPFSVVPSKSPPFSSRFGAPGGVGTSIYSSIGPAGNRRDKKPQKSNSQRASNSAAVASETSRIAKSGPVFKTGVFFPSSAEQGFPPLVNPWSGPRNDSANSREYLDDGWGNTSPQSANTVIISKNKPGVHISTTPSAPETNKSPVESSKPASFPSTPFPSKPFSVVPTKSAFSSRFGDPRGFSANRRNNKNSQNGSSLKSGGFASSRPPTAVPSIPKPTRNTSAATRSMFSNSPAYGSHRRKSLCPSNTRAFIGIRTSAAPSKQGPDGIVYTLDPKLRFEPKLGSFYFIMYTSTKEIQGGQIATHLETGKIYEVLVDCEGMPRFVTIGGYTKDAVLLRVLELNIGYNVLFDSLRLYEVINKELPQPDAEQIAPTVPPKTEDLPEKQKPIEITCEYSDDGWGDTSPQSANPVIARKTITREYSDDGWEATPLQSSNPIIALKVKHAAPFPSKPFSVVLTKSPNESTVKSGGVFGSSHSPTALPSNPKPTPISLVAPTAAKPVAATPSMSSLNKQLPQPDAKQIPSTVPSKIKDLPERQKSIDITREYSDDGWGDTPPLSANPKAKSTTSALPSTTKHFEASKLPSPSVPFPSKPFGVSPLNSSNKFIAKSGGVFGSCHSPSALPSNPKPTPNTPVAPTAAKPAAAGPSMSSSGPSGFSSRGLPKPPSTTAPELTTKSTPPSMPELPSETNPATTVTVSSREYSDDGWGETQSTKPSITPKNVSGTLPSPPCPSKPFDVIPSKSSVNKAFPQPNANQIPLTVPPKIEDLPEKQKPIDTTREYSTDGWGDTPLQNSTIAAPKADINHLVIAVLNNETIRDAMKKEEPELYDSIIRCILNHAMKTLKL